MSGNNGKNHVSLGSSLQTKWTETMNFLDVLSKASDSPKTSRFEPNNKNHSIEFQPKTAVDCRIQKIHH